MVICQTIRNSWVRLFLLLTTLNIMGCSPIVESILPTEGGVGTEVTITGKRLISGSSPGVRVFLAEHEQDLVSASTTEVRFRVRHDTPSGKVVVHTSKGTDTSNETFLMVSEASAADEGFTFNGMNDLQATRVSHTGANQEVIIALVRPKWQAVATTFAAAEPGVTSDFNLMNSFWSETTFGKVSFTSTYLGNQVIELNKSRNYYYYTALTGRIQGTKLPDPVVFPADKSLLIKSNGQDITVDFPAGNMARTDIMQAITDAITNADGDLPPPSFTRGGGAAAAQVTLVTTRTNTQSALLEVTGDAVHYLGFGDSSFYELDNNTPVLTIYGQPINPDIITFVGGEDLTISTLGATTTVNFAAGEITLDDVINSVTAAYPGNDSQQPFDISAIANPLDPTQKILVFKTVLPADDDDGFQLTVGGSARALLGLADAGGLNVAGTNRDHRLESWRAYNGVEETFNNYFATLPAGSDINAIVDSARLLAVVMVDEANFRGLHNWGTFDFDGNNYQANYTVMRSNDLGLVFTHEVGHALRLPDLYRVRPELLGNPPNNWDIMDCSRCDAQTVSWLKARRHKASEDRGENWLIDDQVMSLSPPAAATTLTERVILTPVESPWISSGVNPFSGSYPGVPLRHSVELIPTDDRDVFIVENRQSGVYTADHLGDTVDYSTAIPTEGVIMYQGRRNPSSGVAQFVPINLLTPYTNPLNTVGETYQHFITALNEINIIVVERLQNPDATAGNPSYSYVVDISWGEGSFYDAFIHEWAPPPWESEDIWVDSRAENDWDIYTYEDDAGNPILNGDNIEVGEVNRVYARVHNVGDMPITSDVEVIFRIVVPQRVGEGAASDLETEIGRVTIIGGIPARDSIVAPPLNWTPGNSNDGHVCIRAVIRPVPGEYNASLNNQAQENLTQWFSESSSPFKPVEVNIITENPFKDRETQVLISVPDVPLGWVASVQDVAFTLAPGAARKQKVIIGPNIAYFEPTLETRGYIPTWAATIQAFRPEGDNWVSFGGITASVNPVNGDASLVLDPVVITPPATGLVTGQVTTQGPMHPLLTNRKINIRFDLPDGREFWRQVTTQSNGRFELNLATDIRRYDTLHDQTKTITVQAYHGGGKGIGRIKSKLQKLVIRDDPGGVTPPAVTDPPIVTDPGTGVGGGLISQ